MPKNNRLVPFRCMPGSWGLTGNIYKEAEASYYYDGEELERKLVEIRYADNQKLLQEQMFDLDVKYGRLSAYDRDINLLVTSLPEGLERELAKLDVDFNHGKIDNNSFEKQSATLRQEPWIGIIDQGFDQSQGIDGVFFEMDWNSYWIEFLHLHGYVGHTEEQIVEQWFTDVCKSSTDNDANVSVRRDHGMF